MMFWVAFLLILYPINMDFEVMYLIPIIFFKTHLAAFVKKGVEGAIINIIIIIY